MLDPNNNLAALQLADAKEELQAIPKKHGGDGSKNSLKRQSKPEARKDQLSPKAFIYGSRFDGELLVNKIKVKQFTSSASR